MMKIAAKRFPLELILTIQNNYKNIQWSTVSSRSNKD